MYALAFDLVVKDLEVAYGASYNNAYTEIEKLLGDFDFYRRQGSVYVTDDNDLANLFAAINALKALPWFGPAVRDLRAFKIESWSNFTAYVKGTSNT